MATVTPDNHVRIVPVVLERDTGATIEVASGLDGSERVVKLASSDLEEGRRVEVVP